MIKWLPAHQSLGAAPAAASGEWFTSGCSATRARWNGSTIETDAVLEPRPFPDAVKKWAPEIATSAAKHNVSAPLVAAFMATESGGNPSAATSCCYGLMGFLPKTASWVFNDFKPQAEWKKSLTPEELVSNPAQNVDLGAKLIRHLWDQYKGNVVKMAATYNAGSVKCGLPKSCPTAVPNQWNVVSDCASGKVVDYPGRIILFNNKAVELGVFGGSAGIARKSSGWGVPVLLVGGAAAVWYFGKRRAS